MSASGKMEFTLGKVEIPVFVPYGAFSAADYEKEYEINASHSNRKNLLI
jgi:hypothetical protein